MADMPSPATHHAGLFGMIQDRAWGRLFPVSLLRIPVFVVAALFAIFLSYKAVHNQLTETGILTEDRVSLAAFLDGSVYRPFAYRFLTPVLFGVVQNQLHLTAAGLPGPLKAKALDVCARATAKPAIACDTVVSYAAVAMGFCFLFLMGFYWLANRLFGHPLIALTGMYFAFLCVNATMRLGLSHSYDFAVMFMGTAMLLCLEYRRNLLLTAVLAVSFLTKETLILYAGAAFFVNIGRIPLARNILYFAVQLVLFVVIHGAVRAHFAGNPGEGHEYYLPQQIFFFTEHIVLALLLPMLFATLLVFYDFPNKPETIRRAAVIIAPWFVLYMIGGVQKELRVMLEIYPVVLMLMYDSCVRLVLSPRQAITPR
jgi:hypothetical protein